MRKLLTILFTFSVLLLSAQPQAMLKNEKIKTRRIKFQQAPDGTLVKTEDDKILEHFFYNKQGLLAQSSKYNYTRDGKLQTPVNTIYIYDAQLRLLSDSTDRVKSCYYYNNGSGLMSYSTQYSYKTNVPYRIDSVAYTYNQQNKLATIVHYSPKNEKKTEEQYTYNTEGNCATITYFAYSNGKTEAKKQRQTLFYYNADKLLSETKLIVFTTKSEEIQERKVLAYDNQKRLVCDTLYKKVNEPNGTSAFRLYQKHNYTYTLSDTIPTEVEEFRFNTTSQEFLQTYKFVYQNHLYSEKQTPKASITTQADAPSDVIFQITPPEYTTGLKGYKVLADYTLQDELYTDTHFTLHNQPRGIHFYSVVPVYEKDNIGNCSDIIQQTIKLNLPAPTNPELVYKEYYTKWNVKFKFDAPKYKNLTLKGYRWVASNKSHQATGKTDNPEQLFGTFAYYDKEKVKVELYAIYEEGESDPLTFEIDLTNVAEQVTAHWQNEYSTVKNEDGDIKQTNKYYYTSTSMGETLSFYIAYDAFGQPKKRTKVSIRKYSTKTELEEVDLYNPAKKNWEKHQKTQYLYNSAGALSAKQVFVFDKDKQIFVKDNAEYYFTDPNISYQYPIQTVAYKFNAQGDSTVTALTNSSLEFNGKYLSHQLDSVYASTDITAPLIARIETTFGNKGEIKTRIEECSNNGKLVPNKRENYNYSTETECITRITHDDFRNNNWKNVSTEEFVASKEYHFTRMPKSLTLTKDTLRWKEPERIKDLTGYKILVNGIETGIADTCRWSAMSLPNGIYTFQIVPLYNDREASISEELKVRYKNSSILNDIAALRNAKTNVDYNYTLINEMLVTGQAGNNPNYTFFEDNTAGIAIDTHSLAGYNVKTGDKIGKLKGKLVKEDNGMLLFIPTYLSILSSNNTVTAQNVELKSLLDNAKTLEARLVSLKGITFKSANTNEMLITDNENELKLLVSEGISERPTNGASGDIDGYICQKDKELIFLPARIYNVTRIQTVNNDSQPIINNGKIVLKQTSKVSIFSLNGSLINTLYTDCINLSALPKGTILLQIYHEDGSKNAFKISH